MRAESTVNPQRIAPSEHEAIGLMEEINREHARAVAKRRYEADKAEREFYEALRTQRA